MSTMKTKHSPAPWKIVEPERWPFPIKIRDANDDDVVHLDRAAHSTGQKSIADCRRAVGFKHSEREAVIAALEKQEANARLIAAAPRMYNALVKLRDMIRTNGRLVGWNSTDLDYIEDVIREAENGPAAAGAKKEGRE